MRLQSRTLTRKPATGAESASPCGWIVSSSPRWIASAPSAPRVTPPPQQAKVRLGGGPRRWDEIERVSPNRGCRPTGRSGQRHGSRWRRQPIRKSRTTTATRSQTPSRQLPPYPAISRENLPRVPTSRARTMTRSVVPAASPAGCNQPRILGLRIPRPGRSPQTTTRSDPIPPAPAISRDLPRKSAARARLGCLWLR